MCTVQKIEQNMKGENIMAFDYRKLRGRIVEKYGSQSEFSTVMGLSERTLSLKMNSKVPWKQKEICKAANLLDISDNDIGDYFFTTKVQSVEHKKKGEIQ